MTTNKLDNSEILSEIRDQMRQQTAYGRYRFQIQLTEYYEKVLSSPRNAAPKRLLQHGYKVFSQNDEDGIIQEIFARIGTDSKVFIEFGSSSGLECNTLNLLLAGWRGLWMDALQQDIDFIHQHFSYLIQQQKLKAVMSYINAENIDQLIQTHTLDSNVDLLSIDIDSNDYWVWQAIGVISPRVVIIEYNASIRPPISLVVEYQSNRAWDGSSYFGASLAALEKLGRETGDCRGSAAVARSRTSAVLAGPIR